MFAPTLAPPTFHVGPAEVGFPTGLGRKCSHKANADWRTYAELGRGLENES